MAQEGRIKHTRLPVLSHEKARELLSNRVVDSISSDPDFDELALALVNECKLNPRLICEVADLVKPSGAYAYDLQGCFKYMRATGYIHRYFHPQTASFEKPWHSIELPANPIATGGTGRLYKANCDGQLVAAKVIERKGTSESEYRNYLKLMSREVAALARVNHGNIVRMLGYSIDQPHHSVSPR
eukprot:3234014-Prymnesium_polylepis.1